MTLLLKAPDAVLDYAVDWGTEYLTGEELVSSDWTTDPDEDGGAVIVASGQDRLVATATVSGGLAGRVYRLTNRVSTSAGRHDSRSIIIRVEDR